MIRCIIVDDEPLSIELLSSYASKIDKLNLVQTFSNPLEALAYLQNNEVDLIFLDIQMPELSGIDFAKVVSKNASVIFITAYPEYAVKGFELNAVDYLMKPVTFQRYVESVDRITNNKQKAGDTTDKRDYIMIKTEHRLQKVNLSDILYLKGMGDYVSIVLPTQKIMTLENMKSFQEKLSGYNFMRVHKSYIISIDKIEFIEKNRISIAEELIPISATYQGDFWNKIDANR